MKILVLSDIHSAEDAAAEILEQNRDCDVVIFLGDGERRFELAMAESGLNICGSERQQVYQVAGNCDWDSTEALEIIPEFSGYSFFVSHGHTSGVKAEAGRNALAVKAASRGCRAALFGHTHRRWYEEKHGVILFNPGAVQNYQYGVITIDENGMNFQHREL